MAVDQKVDQSTVRAFLAVPLSDFEAEVVSLIGKLRGQYPRIRWIGPGQVHVTLHFFGNIHRDDIARITQCVLPITTQTSPFDAGLEKLGAFPHLDRPKVIWLGISGAEQALKDFQRRIESGLAVAGFSTEDREFKPHLTLGRVKENIPCPDLTKILFNPTPLKRIREAILFQSRLTPEGPVYDALKTYPLAEA